MSDALAWLADTAAAREAAGLRRRVAVRRPGLLDLAGNDYLGLSRHPRVVAAGEAALREYGAGSTGSRLVTGTTPAHVELDRALAAFVGTEAAVVLSSGYLANIAAVTALSGRGDLVVSDAYVHASLVDACRLSRSRVVVVAHRCVESVERALADREERRALVVTDSVFSVDGDVAPLAELHAVCRSHGAVLLVDDAHAVGVVGAGGRGAVAAAGLAGERDVVVTATLSKALGSQGGAILGARDVVDHVVDAARPFIFDTALAPVSAATARAALAELEAAPALAPAARAAAERIAADASGLGLAVTTPRAAVVSVVVGAPDAAVRAARRMAAHGVGVGVFRPPSVPDGLSRLRLAARADLTEGDFDVARAALEGALCRS